MPRLYFRPMTARELRERLGPDYDDIRGWDADFVRKHLKTFERLNKEFCVIVRDYWRPVESEFFEKVSEFTGFEWQRKRYSCQVWYGTRGCYLYPSGIRIGNRDRGIIAEELFHIHYWDIMKEIYGIDYYELKKLPNWNEIWQLSEVIAKIFQHYYTIPSVWQQWRYDFLKTKLPRVYKTYKKSKSFEELLRKVHKGLL